MANIFKFFIKMQTKVGFLLDLHFNVINIDKISHFSIGLRRIKGFYYCLRHLFSETSFGLEYRFEYTNLTLTKFTSNASRKRTFIVNAK